MQKIKAPLSVQLELTQDCNHQCNHCYNYWRANNKSESTDYNKLLSIVDKIVDAQIFSVTLTGGEPLMIPTNILENIFDNLYSNNVRMGLNSNATLVKQEHIDMLKNYDINVLTSFLSQDPLTFDKITNRVGSHNRTLQGIKKLSKGGIDVAVNMVVDKNNLKDIYSTAKFLSDTGIKSFCATRIVPSYSGMITDYSNKILDKSDANNLLEQLVKIRDDFSLNVAILNPIPYCAVDEPNKYLSIINRHCVAGDSSCSINSNGEMIICQHSPASVGNVLESDLKDLWNKVPKWYEQYINETNCKDCVEANNCRGGCRISTTKNNYFMDDSIKTEPLTSKIFIPEPSMDINSISFKSRMAYRSEDFGGILYNGGSACFVDKLSYELIKELYYRPKITTKDFLEIGRIFSDKVDESYVNNLFNELYNKKLVWRID